MKQSEARDLILMLKAATSKEVLADETVSFWEAQFAPLDADIATKAVLDGVKQWRWFPSWADFRELYDMHRKLAEPVGEQRVSLPVSKPGKHPEWVWVWSWARHRRAPRCFIPFPQQTGFADPGLMMTEASYETLREEWIVAGSPKAEHPIPLAL